MMRKLLSQTQAFNPVSESVSFILFIKNLKSVGKSYEILIFF